MHRFPVVILTISVILGVLSCSDDKKSYQSNPLSPEQTPTVSTRDVHTLVSDSGITQYRITTPVWDMYEEALIPTWKFPKGIYLEKFDENFAVEASIKADSAIYFKNTSVWRLDGHVTIMNIQKEMFLTQQLFWDQRQQLVYSDSFIHIERADRIIEGYGFKSNERMTRYTLHRPSGIFPAEQFMPRDTANRSVIDK